jgi:hypothetical protein
MNFVNEPNYQDLSKLLSNKTTSYFIMIKKRASTTFLKIQSQSILYFLMIWFYSRKKSLRKKEKLTIWFFFSNRYIDFGLWWNVIFITTFSGYFDGRISFYMFDFFCKATQILMSVLSGKHVEILHVFLFFILFFVDHYTSILMGVSVTFKSLLNDFFVDF